MKKPVLKNYIIIGCVKTIGELWKVLHSDQSIYVRTWDRVHPCKFFLNNDRCFTIKRLEKMVRESAFYRISKITDLKSVNKIWLSHKAILLPIENAKDVKIVSNPSIEFSVSNNYIFI